MSPRSASVRTSSWLGLAALGAVFGDIGTGPLYALRQCFTAGGASVASPAEVLGVVSLLFWSLLLVVGFKYLLLIVRADNQGQGGLMALLALVPEPHREIRRGRLPLVSLLVIAGAALLFGDGVLTPAISVLSASEGLATVAPLRAPLIVPLACFTLTLLFLLQGRGGRLFDRWSGPLMLLWFFALALLGTVQIWQKPEVLAALLPSHALWMLGGHAGRSLRLLGSVVLAVTGAEALSANLGRFGRRPIRWSWITVACPSLAICYLGQGALLLRDPSAVVSPFFLMAESSGVRWGLLLLSLAATTVASRAMISAVFSLAQQAMRLGYFPRIALRHTSEETECQVYLPTANRILAVVCLALVMSLRSSAKLAAAYGLAASGAMVITSLVFAYVAQLRWKWPRWKAVGVTALFLCFDLPLFVGSLAKFHEGGYLPVVAGAAFFAVMSTWCAGRALMRDRLAGLHEPVDRLCEFTSAGKLDRLDGLGVYLTSLDSGLPYVLTQQARRFETLPRELILLTIAPASRPYVDDEQRCQVQPLPTADGTRAYRVTARFGYMEPFDVPAVLRLAAPHMQLETSIDHAVYVVSRQTYAATDQNLMGATREGVYSLLTRLSQDISEVLRLPPRQVVELGIRLDL